MSPISEEMQMSEWLPIETAPMDGTEILSINAFNRMSKAKVIEFDGNYWRMVGAFNPPPIPRTGHGSPTHWMPIPDRPK